MKKTAEKKHSRWPYVLIVVLLALGIAYSTWVLTAAIPDIQPTAKEKFTNYIAPSNALPWPSYGESAVGLNDLGAIATNGTQKQVPMASTAKLITALCVLAKQPLALGAQGPTITLTPTDVATYDKYQAEDGSDTVVVSGEQLSEYQMLEVMLLPSADNIADSLATWAFGSLSNYNTYANQYLVASGLINTRVGVDASGFDPSTTSTASDLIKLGKLAMNNPVIAQIVAKPSVSGIPLVSSVTNINKLLGVDNIVGVKTGNTNQAGGVFLAAAKIMVNNQPTTVYTAVMQAPNLFDAMNSTLPLMKAAESNFSSPTAITKLVNGTVVGSYRVPWSKKTVYGLISRPIDVQSWGGSEVAETIGLKAISDKARANEVIGNIVTSSGLLKATYNTSVVLSTSPGQPSKWWVLLHPSTVVRL